VTEPDDREHGATETAVETEAASQQQAIDAKAENTEQAQSEVVVQEPEDVEPLDANRQLSWLRVLAYGVLPGLALLLAMAAGFLTWRDSLARGSEIARVESVTAAKDSTIALLAYQPDTVEKSVAAAQDRVTAPFKDAYTQLTHDVVIPGAKQKHVSVSVTVPAAASVSATPQHAVALLFVNQSAAVGANPPINTISSIRVTLQKIGGRWLISGFDPV
jgi:Mce-associated membrane protein